MVPFNPEQADFTRYLAAKVSVDDRALNRYVWARLAGALHESSPSGPLRVLEVGAGTGTMIDRTLRLGLFPGDVHYTALDAQAANTAAAQQRLRDHARAQSDAPLSLRHASGQMMVEFVTADVFDFLRREHPRRWDVLIAHAFLDLVDVPAALAGLFSVCQPNGLFYFTINFDGVTAFQPTIDLAFDHQIERLYHADMDQRSGDGQSSGDSHTGRHLFQHIPASGGTILAAGSSDWVVHPVAGRYPHDEAYFLHFIVHTIHQALDGHPLLDQAAFRTWIDTRHRQIKQGELTYIAHQLDVLGHV